MNKKELECFTLAFFKEHYAGFPIGEIIQDECPDFTIRNRDTVIGIEVGEVFQDLNEGNSGSYLKSIERRHEKTGQALINALRDYTDLNFIVDIEFSSLHDFTNPKIGDIVRGCLAPCLEFIMNNLEGWVSIYNDQCLLPMEVNSIYIQMLKENTVYSNVQGGSVANLHLKHIEGILAKHEKKLIDYKPCKEHWFLIREGNYYAGSFNDVIIKAPVESKFDKVFIVRTSKNVVVELK